MPKAIVERVRDSFSGDDRESIAKYVDWARSTLTTYYQNSRRMATLLIIVAAIFELIVYSPNQSVIVASFIVVRGSVVLYFLPVLVAYILYQNCTDSNKSRQLGVIYKEIFKLWSEKAEKNDLDVPLLGPSPLYWNVSLGKGRAENTYPSNKVEIVGSRALTVAIFLGIIYFEGQAYYLLFATTYPRIMLWIISLGLTLFFLVITISATAAASNATAAASNAYGNCIAA
jgi:hypothetical protein